MYGTQLWENTLRWEAKGSPRCVSICGEKIVVSGDTGRVSWLNNWRKAPKVILHTATSEEAVDRDVGMPRSIALAKDWVWVCKAMPGFLLAGALDRSAYLIKFHAGKV
jgi:hypothetical protein